MPISFSGGIAVHTSDLSPAERRIVETAVQRGEILLICATGTLAEGLNFPVVNVITTKQMYATRPEDAATGNAPAPQPISLSRLLNMIGRAGRLGFCHFGRGMIATTSLGDVEGLKTAYMQKNNGHLDSLLSLLSLLDPERVILESMGGYASFTLDQCLKFIKKNSKWTLPTIPGRLMKNRLSRTLIILSRKNT